jgi:peptidyl-tRNA hydrolase
VAPCPIGPGDKLYLITRRDLSPGLQLAQAVHGALEVAKAEPHIVAEWLTASNYLVILSAHDVEELQALRTRLLAGRLTVHDVTEPDLDGELTALVVLPHPEARRYLSPFPLALKATVDSS